MANIYQLPTPLPANVGISPVFKFMVSGDSLSTVTTAGYLNQVSLEGYPVNNGDVIQALIDYIPATAFGTYAVFTASIAAGSGIITLEEFNTASGGVVLPTTVGSIATYNSTEGELTQNPTIAATTGSILAGGNITSQSGIISAGELGNQGILYLNCEGGGNFVIEGGTTGGSYQTLLTNSEITRNSNYTIPVIAGGTSSGATANLAIAETGAFTAAGQLVAAFNTSGALATSGFKLLYGITSAFTGGTASTTYTATGLTTSSVVTGVILSSTNTVSITKIIAEIDSFLCYFSADPGANTTVQWQAVVPA